MKIDILIFQSKRRDNEPIIHEADLMRQAAAEKGHDVRLIFAYKFSFVFTAQGTNFFYENKPYENPDIVIAWVGMLNNVAERAAALREIRLRNVPIVNNLTAVVRTRDKFRTMQILSDKKLPVIKTSVLYSLDNLDNILDAIGEFPIIAKTIFGNDGKGVAVFESKRSLISGIELMMDNNISCESILIQEFVKADNKDYRLFVVGGKVVAQMERQAPEGDFRANLDGGGMGIQASLPPEVIKLGEDAAQALDLDIAGVDILIGEDGPVICEINPRPGFKISEITNTNVAKCIIDWTEEKYKIFMNKGKAA